MKKTISIIFLLICLISSLLLNLYQKKTNERLGKLPSFKNNMMIFGEMKVKYPINGIKENDVIDILNVLKTIEEYQQEINSTHGILSIEVYNNDYIIVEIGFAKGPCHGGGKYFGFIRSSNGWIFDERTRNFVWVS
jgi:hypothetical protein